MNTRTIVLIFALLSACGPAPQSLSPKPSASSPPLVLLPSGSPLASASPGAVAGTPAPAAKGPTRLELSRTSFTAGEDVVVKFSVDPASVSDPTAWIGLIPSEVPHGSESENDKYDLAFQYLEGKTTGEMRFPTPEEPGNYDLRLHDKDENGRELTSVSFTVTGPVKPLTGNALALDKSRYAPGETITVTVSIKAEDKLDKSAWLGIVPAAVDHGDEKVNDRYNLGYKYLGDSLFGKTTLTAPKAPGLYDIRLHDTDDENKPGRELAFITFAVE